jgi:hypothetical protein
VFKEQEEYVVFDCHYCLHGLGFGGIERSCMPCTKGCTYVFVMSTILECVSHMKIEGSRCASQPSAWSESISASRRRRIGAVSVGNAALGDRKSGMGRARDLPCLHFGNLGTVIPHCPGLEE